MLDDDLLERIEGLDDLAGIWLGNEPFCSGEELKCLAAEARALQTCRAVATKGRLSVTGHFRLWLFLCAIAFASHLVPKDCIDTWLWLRKIPFEE